MVQNILTMPGVQAKTTSSCPLEIQASGFDYNNAFRLNSKEFPEQTKSRNAAAATLQLKTL